MPFPPPPSRHPLTTTNWHDSMSSQVNDNSNPLRLPMPHGVNTTISQQPPLPHSMNSIAHGGGGGTSSSNSGNSNFMIGQEGDSSIRFNANAASAMKNDQRIPSFSSSSNMLPHQIETRGLPPTSNLALFSKYSYPGLEHFKVPAAVAETALKVQQSQQRLGRDANCIPETVAIYALNLSGTNIPGTNKPKRVVTNDNELRTSIERGELYTKHESVVIGILTNQVHVPGFNIADYLTREKFAPHEMENIENIHCRIDPYQLICLMEFIRYRYPPELRQRAQTNLPHHQAMDSNLTNTQQFLRNSNAAFSPMPGPSPYERSRKASQSPSDTTRSQQRPPFGGPYQGPSLASSPRMNPIFLNQKPAQNLPLLKVSSPYQPPPRSHSTIGGIGLGSPIRLPPAAHQNSSRPNIPGAALDMSNPPIAAHLSSKTPQMPKLDDRPKIHPSRPSVSHLEKQSEIDNSNGLPMQAMLRQQELAFRRSITPQFTSQGQPRNIEIPRYDLGPRSPSQMQDFYGRIPSGPQNINMPPPHSRPSIPNGQYPTMMSGYQHQQSLDPKTNLITSQHNSQTQIYYPNYSVPNNLAPSSQQPPSISPKQQNQRSIITGLASTNNKRLKKPKSSPPISAQQSIGTAQKDSSDIKVSTLNYPNNIQLQPHSGNITGDNQLGDLAAVAAAAPNIHMNQPPSGITTDIAILQANNIAAETCSDSDNAHFNENNNSASTDIAKNINALSDTGVVSKPDDLDINKNNRNNGEKSTQPIETEACIISNKNAEPISEPSKYQKLFTKKAWLKTYDQEDQAKVSEVIKDESMAPKINAMVDVEANRHESTKENTKSNQSGSKSNGCAKNTKSTSPDSKRKGKPSRGKSNSLPSLKNNRENKSNENDSEETTASTSDLDDTTDEADSIKQSGDKKLRRMPRRKVKNNLDRESNSTGPSSKPKSPKDAVRKRIKKEKSSLNNSDNDSNSASKRKYNSDDESVHQKTKKMKDNNEKWDQSDENRVRSKKRPGEKFLQTCPCYDIVPKNIRCMECRRVRQSSLKGDRVIPSKQTSRTNWDDFCRFYEFRKLRYNKSDQIIVAGFSEMNDAKEGDKNLWLPNSKDIPENFNFDVAKFILTKVGPEFCNLVLQERSVQDDYKSKSNDKKITWKRAVNGLRELCDVCSTTLFNCHFVCERCGFVVCIDCHHQRLNQQAKIKSEPDDFEMKKQNSPINDNGEEQANLANKKSKKDSNGWIYCAKNEEHSADKMILARIVAGDCLEEVWNLLHETREKLDLDPCPCKRDLKEECNELNQGSDSNGSHTTLKGLLLARESEINNIKTVENQNGFKANEDVKVFDFANDDDSQDDSRQVSAAIEECIASLSNPEPQAVDESSDESNWTTLCGGDLLVLKQPNCKQNLQLFRDHWLSGKPVLVRGVHKLMNIDLWLPQFFAVQFGDYRSDLVDCRNGDIHRQSMKKYWDGFEPNVNTKKKTKDESQPAHISTSSNEEPSAIATTYYSGSPLWRLKDWPPGQDFNEILPEHYNDFMNNLPLKSYTTRTGKLNLACRLPKEMLKPDLGPKMYSAYGSTSFPERGTTNLHLDISDAINVMVYVGGATSFLNGSQEMLEMFDKTVEETFVDDSMKAQIRDNNLIPGALWHIFKPSDASTVRDFLNKVADERKISPEKRTDPIHDQIWYLDQNLLDRLHKEFGVKSYPILQCMGDAILIPAGAPHQVKNLQNCIKVANDFVSPENVSWCLRLTDEFRKLPETHINQEDKLQIKNILYHSVKESLQFIKMSNKRGSVGTGSGSDTEEERIESESEGNFKKSTKRNKAE